MTWGKNDDGLHEHDKFRNLSATAIGIWTVTRSWSSQNETDGFIPADIVRRKVSQHARGHRSPKVAQELVDAGLWDVGIGGWMIHDFADWNETRAQKQARRTGDARRQRDARAKLPRSSRDPRDELARSSGRKTAGKRVASRRESQPLEVEVEREERLETSSLVALRRGAAELIAAGEPVNASHIVAAWIDHRRGEKPTPGVLGQVSRTIRVLLEADVPPIAVLRGVLAWQDTGFGIGYLQKAVDNELSAPIGPVVPAKRIGSRNDQMLVEVQDTRVWAQEMDRHEVIGEIS